MFSARTLATKLPVEANLLAVADPMCADGPGSAVQCQPFTLNR